MIRRQLPKISIAVFFGVLIIALSHHHGSANNDPEDRKLEAFIEAAATVDGVIAYWQPRIASADGQSASVLREQANIDIRKSIEEVDGISFAEYREIRKTLATDSDMLARVTEIMRRQR